MNMKMSQPLLSGEHLATPAYGQPAPVDLIGPVDEVWTPRETDISKMAFHEYVEAVDEAMLRLWMIDTFDAQLSPDVLSDALDDGVSPNDFAARWGADNGLIAH